MKTLFALLVLIPSLSLGNHEVLICDSNYNYSYSKDHTSLYANYSDGTIGTFEKINSNDVWTFFKHPEKERYRSYNKYSKEMFISGNLISCEVHKSLK